jgi:hypothetical protein
MSKLLEDVERAGYMGKKEFRAEFLQDLKGTFLKYISKNLF